MSEKTNVWSQLADGRWLCWVEREDVYVGVLRVQDQQNPGHPLVLCQEVELLYGALFGPDVCDVDAWQQICIKAIDAHVGEE